MALTTLARSSPASAILASPRGPHSGGTLDVVLRLYAESRGLLRLGDSAPPAVLPSRFEAKPDNVLHDTDNEESGSCAKPAGLWPRAVDPLLYADRGAARDEPVLEGPGLGMGEMDWGEKGEALRLPSRLRTANSSSSSRPDRRRLFRGRSEDSDVSWEEDRRVECSVLVGFMAGGRECGSRRGAVEEQAARLEEGIYEDYWRAETKSIRGRTDKAFLFFGWRMVEKRLGLAASG